MNTVSFPLTFLLRSCDDALRHEIAAAGYSDEFSKLALFLIWQNFAMGGSCRREICAEGPVSADPRVLSIERSCGWLGTPGLLIDLAIACGLLVVEKGESGRTLLCSGFQEFNRGKVKSIQRHGGLMRALKSHLRDAEKCADDKEELWRRTGGGVFEGLHPDRRRAAMVFLMRVCRALSKSLPSDAVLSNGTIHLAAKVVEAHGDTIDATLLWLFDRKGEIDIPERLDEIMRAWPDYSRQASAVDGNS